MGRPELGPIAVGDEVFVHDRTNRNQTVEPATVVKVGRIWVTLRSSYNREWRMLKAGQRTDSGYGYESTFATAAQLAYDNEVAAARKVLDEHGISIRPGAILSGPEGTLMLAKILRNAGATIEP